MTLGTHISFDDEFCELYKKLTRSDQGKQFLSIAGIGREHLDIHENTTNYFRLKVADMSVDPNANVGQTKSYNTWRSEVYKPYDRLEGYYLLWRYTKKEYGSEEAARLIKKALTMDVYVHDLTKISQPYCFAPSTSNLMLEGRPYGQLKSVPPTRSDSFISQVIETTMDFSQEQAGAVAWGDLFVNYAYMLAKELLEFDTSNSFSILFNVKYGRLDNVNEELRIGIITKALQEEEWLRKKVTNDFQRFVHTVNNNFRIGGDSPFTNLSLFCRASIKNIFEDYRFPNGEGVEGYTELIMECQKLFALFMTKKSPSGLPYRFPVTTLNLYVNKDKGVADDQEFFEDICELNQEGLFNIFISHSGAQIASCCRMINDVSQMSKFRFDSFGNGGLNIGSARVITLNLGRYALESKDYDDFEERVMENMDDTFKLLVAHRKLLAKKVKSGFLKFATMGWLNIDKMLFSTFGVIGIWEAFDHLGLNYLEDEDARKKVFRLLDKMNEKKDFLMGEHMVPLNIEQIPAEGAAITMSRADKILFGDAVPEIYGNQFIPLWIPCDIFERAHIDGQLDQYFGGGVISHLNVGHKCSTKQVKALLEMAIEEGMQHFSINPVFSKCKNDHAVIGEMDKCAECGEQMEQMTRVVGYFTPVKSWSKTRRKLDFPEREYRILKKDSLETENPRAKMAAS